MTAAIVILAAALAAQPARGFLHKPDGAIRVLTWNIYRDSIFPAQGEAVEASGANRPAQFARVLQALRPDVVCLQQVTASAERSASLVNGILPLPEGGSWQAHAAVDTVILTRFAISARAEGHVEEGSRRRGHAIALLDAPPTSLYVVCAHFQSSDSLEDIAMRRHQAQLIVNTIRDDKARRGGIPLRPRTPFIVLGDFNSIHGGMAFVDAQAAASVVSPTISGRIERLDWDRSALTDALPRHNGAGPRRYTWRDDLDRFPPGILDRILYSDSVLASVNQFVLDTTSMTYDELTKAGLRAIDVMRDPQAGIHDHFPVVVDLVPKR